AGLNHAGLQLHSTRELTWKCLTEFWASRTY
ncbi:MAG: beta-phosphoglucomutase, partial [Enterobacter sp.]|nr:beta-phosphoglucomutase [Enterobacter sp.]